MNVPLFRPSFMTSEIFDSILKVVNNGEALLADDFAKWK
jgi:hypothetical protein